MAGEMVTFDQIKTGDVIWHRRMVVDSFSHRKRLGFWPVHVRAKDEDGRTAMLSLNGGEAVVVTEADLHKFLDPDGRE